MANPNLHNDREIEKLNRWIDKIAKTPKKNLQKVADWMSMQFAGSMKTRIKFGEGQPPYSTRPSWYGIGRSSNRPRDTKSRFEPYLRSKGYSATRAKRATFAFMDRGYAQFRAIYRNESVKTRPVSFQLTGQMLENLTAKGVVSPAKTKIRVTPTFKKNTRSYGKLTNTQLMKIIDSNWKGTGQPRGTELAFAIKRKRATNILKRAIEMILED